MRFVVSGIIAIALIAGGCTKDESTPQPAADIELWQDELPIHEPWLRDHLPDDSLIYLRVPQVTGMLAMPKGNALDPALRSSANIRNVIAIQQGVIDNVLPDIPALADPLLRAWQEHVRSPVEVSAVFVPAPAALIAVTTDLNSDDAFEMLLDEAGFSLVAPLDDQDIGEVSGAPSPVMVQFDESTGRLLINAGPGVRPESFTDIVASLDRSAPHPMRKLESRIDESGQGLVLWMDPQKAIPMMQMSVPREQFNQLMALGLDRATGVALGWGVAGGKGRVALLADIPTEEERGFLPYIDNDIRAMSVGEPDAVFAMSIPSVEEFRRLEALILDTLPPEAQNEWKNAKNDMERTTGIGIEEIFSAVGPDLLLILDRSGDYVAIRVRDSGLWSSIVERIGENTGVAPETRRIDGRTYYHLDVPADSAEIDVGVDIDINVPTPWYSELLGRQRDHLYWSEENDYLYLASVPQVLFDRAALGANVDVGEWMATKQGIDTENTVLTINGSSYKLTRRLYGIYLELMQAAGDIAFADIDIWSMPSAEQAGLPMRGTLAFTLNFGNPTLSAEVTFETNPAELAGSMTGIAAVGVMAAIAIPAYQDYTVRAQIASGLNLASGTKARVTEYFRENGAYPGSRDAEDMTIGPGNAPYVQLVSVEPFTGIIIIDYLPSIAGTGGQIRLRPSVEAGGIIAWSCSGTFQFKHLPAMCRE